MESKHISGSDRLKISVAAPPLWTYLAGDTIIGSVNCPHLRDDAIISLALVGHAKTLIEKGAHAQKNQYHGVWELFEFAPQVLHQGPVHSQDTSETNIPFSINIPETASLSVPRDRDHAQAESFVPLHAAYIAQHPLPGTFSAEWLGAKLGIEYHLRAQFQYKCNDSWVIQRATAPITLGHPTIDPSTICFALQRRSIPGMVCGIQLPPSIPLEKLSLTQRTRRMFSLSKTPEFHFTVDMLMPLHIQFDNPTPIPLVLRVVPREKGTSGSIRDVAQSVKINRMGLSVLSKVEIICKSDNNSGQKVLRDENVFTQHLGLRKAFEELEEPIITSSGPPDQQINIGSLLQLVLRQDGLRSGDVHLSQFVDIQPSFVTFNIKLSHRIIWDVSLDIAGETRQMSSEVGVTIHNNAMRL